MKQSHKEWKENNCLIYFKLAPIRRKKAKEIEDTGQRGKS